MKIISSVIKTHILDTFIDSIFSKLEANLSMVNIKVEIWYQAKNVNYICLINNRYHIYRVIYTPQNSILFPMGKYSVETYNSFVTALEYRNSGIYFYITEISQIIDEHNKRFLRFDIPRSR
jgi:hypothetical protein